MDQNDWPKKIDGVIICKKNKFLCVHVYLVCLWPKTYVKMLESRLVCSWNRMSEKIPNVGCSSADFHRPRLGQPSHGRAHLGQDPVRLSKGRTDGGLESPGPRTHRQGSRNAGKTHMRSVLDSWPHQQISPGTCQLYSMAYHPAFHLCFKPLQKDAQQFGIPNCFPIRCRIMSSHFPPHLVVSWQGYPQSSSIFDWDVPL